VSGAANEPQLISRDQMRVRVSHAVAAERFVLALEDEDAGEE
jgi:hypothetical protein